VSAGLVAAVCHEIGNLLAGARLLASERAAGDPARIARSLARAGALTALVPALVDARPRSDRRHAADPLEVLEGLWRGIDAKDELRLRVELRSAALLPCAALDAETLHHLLLAHILAALDEGAGAVTVAASGAPGAICFRVQGLAPDLAAASLPRALAEALLGPCGGRAETLPGPGAPGIALWVPEAPRQR